MKILVTGGAGFIGSHLVDKLIDLGHDITIVDNLSTGNKNNINERANFYEGDINDANGLRTVFDKERPEFIFHLAAQINLRDSIKDPVADAKTNIIGSLNLIQLAKEHNVRQFIFTSTGGAIYSPNYGTIPWAEHTYADPKSPYGLAKLTIEKYLKISGLEHTCFRLANVYGPRQNSKGEAGVIAIFIDRAINKEDLIIFGDGEQTRDFIYVDDVVHYLVESMKGLTGVFNLGTAEETSVNTIVEVILEELKSSYESELKVMHDVKVIHKDPIPGELRRSALLAFELMKKKLWHGTNITLREGIKRTVKYFK